MTHSSVSIILPTFEEAENLPAMIDAIATLRSGDLPGAELLIVDDNSQDGTEELVDALDLSWVRLITRRGERGLSSAVIRGLAKATGDIFVVMDADGSHPVDAIPRMVAALVDGGDFAVGSRYVPGGTTEDGWGVLRWINSKIATIMARVFTRVKDPMSGFLAMRRETWEQADTLDPIGYKIGLELIVKCGCRNVVEVPIHFRTRQEGQSKLTLRVQWEYLVHCIRLYRYTHPKHVSFLTFAAVGASGVIVYLAALMVTSSVIPTRWLAIGIAVLVAMTWNFIFDRLWAFWYARRRNIALEYFGFVAICTVGAGVNGGMTLWLSSTISLPVAGLIGAAIGSAVGLIVNFILSRLLVFRRQGPR
ncbi:MAG: glycosyltransferase family 2 protein [Phycisphaerales bacterium]|jgi:dolichol-phosphate mannosyltransferase|nr:glycosyltransferase family 2 protein [Phycisphaerales bacterium]